jgi:prepilin-type N-terminal cleavage/methylation domain-containing protein
MKKLQTTNYKLQTNKGFTLIEVLVAIAIFSVGTAVSVNVISYSLGLSAKIKDRTIATHLAQEGVEIVKNIRDLNWLDGKAFDLGLGDGWGCIEYNSNAVDYNCALNAGSDLLSFDGTHYIHGAGVTTNFSRKITISTVSLVEKKIISDVSCGVNCSVTLENHLFDWK